MRIGFDCACVCVCDPSISGRAEAAAQLKLQVIWSFNRCCILFERKETGFRLRAVRVHDSWSAIHLGLVDDALWPEHTPLNAPHELYFYSNLFARCASFLQKLSAAAFFFLVFLRILFYFYKIYLLPPNETHSGPCVLRFLWESFRHLFGKIKGIQSDNK